MDRTRYSSTLGFAGVLAGSLLLAIDAVALAPSLPAIADTFNSSSIETYWAGVAYTLGSAVFMPLFPASSAACGRRSVVIACQILFLIGTIVCGSASSIEALLAGRSIQGIGGGGIVGMLYVVISDLFDMRWRPKALAINGLVWLVGSGTGPVLGGGFSTYVSWRWIFWIVIPINVVGIALTGLFLDIPMTIVGDEKPVEGRINLRLLSWHHMDYFGAFLLVTSLSSFLIPICWGGIQFSWSSYQTLVPLILGIAGIIGFLLWEGFIPKKPIMPPSILANRTVAIAFMATFVAGVVQFGIVFFLPLYYQVVKGYSPLISGVALLPVTVLSAPSTMAAGIIISKTGKYKMVLLVGWALMSLGTGILVLLEIDTSVPAWIFISFPVGTGFGMVLPALTTASTAPVKQEHMSTAYGLSPYTRLIGQAIGIAVGNSMVQNLVKSNLSSSSSPVLRENAALIARSITSKKILALFMTNATEKRMLLEAFVGALQNFWWLLCGLCLACVVASCFLKDYSLDRDSTIRKVESDDSMAENGVALRVRQTEPKSDKSNAKNDIE